MSTEHWEPAEVRPGSTSANPSRTRSPVDLSQRDRELSRKGLGEAAKELGGSTPEDVLSHPE